MLKRNKTYPDPEQRVWLAELGEHAEVWRPRDAAEVLDRLARTCSPAESRSKPSIPLDSEAPASDGSAAVTEALRPQQPPFTNERTPDQ